MDTQLRLREDDKVMSYFDSDNIKMGFIYYEFSSYSLAALEEILKKNDVDVVALF